MHSGLTININWAYFLGIFGAMITLASSLAWYSSARFTALEIDMKWVKDILHDLKIASDNAVKPVFSSKSPVNLNETGIKWLAESGLKDYIDSHKVELMKRCEDKKTTNPYEVQEHVFKLFDTMQFDGDFEDKLKKFAFEKGSSMNIVRRVGGIYFRNLCLEAFGMDKEDIDKHNPEQPTK